jgi:trans-aconitate 2-methyltransferase
MSWNPAQYLQYAGERLRPALDLVARVGLDAPRAVVDLGCGAGNVTQLLADRWPEADILGIDNDARMLERARQALADRARVGFAAANLETWAPQGLVDVLFSNAALHWADDHATLLPRLLRFVAPGGVLAVQMPSNFAAPSHRALQATAGSARWRARLEPLARPEPVAPASRYYDWLAPEAAALDLWTTEYLQVLGARSDGEHPVVAWMRGTALVPFVGALDEDEREAFVADFAARIAGAYVPRADGTVLFPFRRLFVVARRGSRQGSPTAGVLALAQKRALPARGRF